MENNFGKGQLTDKREIRGARGSGWKHEKSKKKRKMQKTAETKNRPKISTTQSKKEGVKGNEQKQLVLSSKSKKSRERCSEKGFSIKEKHW